MPRPEPLVDAQGEIRETRTADLKRFVPAAEALPASLRRKVGIRGPQKAPTKERVTIRPSAGGRRALPRDWNRLADARGRCAQVLARDSRAGQVAMTASKQASRPSLGSDLALVARHVFQPVEYDALPEMNNEMIASGKVNEGGRPSLPNPKRLNSIRLSEGVIERWRATGPGWQTRLADKLTKSAPE